MSKNTLARSVVAMLIWRKRKAYRQWLREENSATRSESLCLIHWGKYQEAFQAEEAARRMLYGIDD